MGVELSVIVSDLRLTLNVGDYQFRLSGELWVNAVDCFEPGPRVLF